MQPNISPTEILVYGSYGFTGKLIIEEFRRREISVTLGGRNESRLKLQSEKSGFPFVCFTLDDPQLATHIQSYKTILNCAGPFQDTSFKLASVCAQKGINYLNVTGEFDVIDELSLLDKQARLNNCVILPGVGFDVTPSDCLFAYAHQKFSGAHKARLCIAFSGRPSRGTLRTALEQYKKGGIIRKRGVLSRSRIAGRSYKVNFRDKTRTCVSIPWGDVSSAYFSTKIPNIEVFLALPAIHAQLAKLAGLFQRVLKFKPFSSLASGLIERQPEGPNPEELKKGTCRLYLALMDFGARKSFLLKTPEPYTLTAQIAADATIRVTTNTVKAGFHTPSTAFGMNYIMKFKGVERTELVHRKKTKAPVPVMA